MRNVKFILAAAAILLTGAIAAGLAARAVTAPDGEQVQSAGTVSIPTVLGQTAEEVLFYPWSLYDTETLSPIPENYLADLLQVSPDELPLSDFQTIGELRDLYVTTSTDMGVAMFLFPFELPDGPVRCDIPALLRALEWNRGADGRTPAGGEHYYLADFPAALPEGDIPVTLSMALSVAGSRTDYSFLIRPAKPAELTEAERQAALARVKEELLDLLLNGSYLDYGFTDDELYTGLLMSPGELTLEYDPADIGEAPAGSGGTGTAVPRPGGEGSALGRLLRDYLRPNEDYCASKVSQRLTDLFYPVVYNGEYLWDRFYEDPTLDGLLDLTADMGLSVQIITTQDQVVVLFSQSGGSILGVYYDIQLGCWSGIGWRTEL